MNRITQRQLESLIARDKGLSDIFPPGVSLRKLVSKEDYEKLLKGKVCLKWIITPEGKRKCVEWKEE